MNNYRRTHLLFRLPLLSAVFALLCLGAFRATAAATIAIANWDAVPYDRIVSNYNVGVVAFHENGVKVSMRVMRGATVISSNMVNNPTYNPQSKVWEYWVTINPTGQPDGQITVEATAIPLTGGVNNVLTPLPLYLASQGAVNFGNPAWVDSVSGNDTTGNGTQTNPVRTIAKAMVYVPDGGTIYLKAGTYSADALTQYTNGARIYWTTITAAPGVTRDQAEISNGRPGLDKLCFRNVTLFADPATTNSVSILTGENGTTSVWLDGAKAYNKKGRWYNQCVVLGNNYNAYVTGGITTDLTDGPNGFLRDHDIYKISSDALKPAQTAINVRVEDIDPGNTGNHPDFWQVFNTGTNYRTGVILYNCRGIECSSQGIFSNGGSLKDCAIVNCLFDKVAGTAFLSQYLNDAVLDHILFFNITVGNQTWRWRDIARGTNDCRIINSIFSSMTTEPTVNLSGMLIDYNHFISTNTMGSHITTGAAMFVNEATNNFRLLTNSPAYASGTVLQCVPADIEGNPYGGTPNRGCYAAAPSGDTTPPTVSITAPANGAFLRGTSVTVSATASDNVAVVGVQFKLDGANLSAEDTSSPYSITWNTTTAANGAHTLTAVARDAAGNTTTSAAVNVTVDNQAPTVSITSPANGAHVRGTAQTIPATASDNIGVVGVQYKLDGANLGSEDLTSPYSITWNTTTTTDGPHTLTAVARDAAGNTTTSAVVNVTVDNTLPTVAITAPTDGLTVFGGSVAITATASDANLAGVQFKLNGANLGAEDTAAPFAISWNTFLSANGTYALTAVARDIAGNTTTSTAINVNVVNQTVIVPGFTNWVNIALDNQIATFTAEWDLSPSANQIDVVMGLSNGGVQSTNLMISYTNLAVIVRFNTNGFVDARNGGAYAAQNSIPYVGGGDYHIRVAVNVPTHTYSAYVTAAGGAEQIIGTNYAFRTEQGGVTQLNNLGTRLSLTNSSAEVGNAVAYDTALKAWLRLDEFGGLVAFDTSKNTNSGALANGPIWTNGVLDGALSFDGVDDVVTLPASATLTNLTQFTYTAWIKPAGWGEGNFGRIFSREPSSGLDFYFHVQLSGNTLVANIVNSTNATFLTQAATNSLSLNIWQHVAVTYDNTGDRKLHLYINGAEATYVMQPAVTGTLKLATNPLLIGNRPANDRTFNGLIDDARVYNRVLTPAEINAVKNAP